MLGDYARSRSTDGEDVVGMVFNIYYELISIRTRDLKEYFCDRKNTTVLTGSEIADPEFVNSQRNIHSMSWYDSENVPSGDIYHF